MWAIAARLLGPILKIFGGWQAAIVVILASLLSAVLYNVAVDLINDLMGYALGQMEAATNNFVAPGETGGYQFSGVAGWMLGCLNFPEVVSLWVNIILLKWTLRKIPFIKW